MEDLDNLVSWRQAMRMLLWCKNGRSSVRDVRRPLQLNWRMAGEGLNGEVGWWLLAGGEEGCGGVGGGLGGGWWGGGGFGLEGRPGSGQDCLGGGEGGQLEVRQEGQTQESE